MLFRFPSCLLAGLVTAVCAGPALAFDWEGVFEGTIGKAHVLVELNAGADASAYKGGYEEGARYSYAGKIYDLYLIARGAVKSKGESEHLAFVEALDPPRMMEDAADTDPRYTGQWALDVSATGATGRWTSMNGKKSLPIVLTRLALVPQEKVGQDSNQLSATYGAQWITSVRFADEGKSQSFGDVEVRSETDSAFHIGHPMLGAFPDAARKDAANAALHAHYVQAILQYRECRNGTPAEFRPEGESEDEPQFGYTLTYASPTLLSFEDSGSVDCGGAHPSNYVNPITFDLTGQAQIGGRDDQDLAPENFGRLLKLANKEERVAFENFAIGRWMENAKRFPDSEDCQGGFLTDAPEGERALSLAPTAKGLSVLRTDYPHVASNCLAQDWNPLVIPWADLKPFLKTGQALLVDEVK